VQLAAWNANPAMKHLTQAVNVSVLQLLDTRFVDIVKEILRSSGADPWRLKLEITESSIMGRVEVVIAKMTELKTSGITFSLDDFGTGYSSLSYLRNLPFDQLKIERTFTAQVLSDERSASIARTVIVLARALNLSVIAEGVETQAQQAFLLAEGCHLYQGFLYSRAIPSLEFEAFVAASCLLHQPQ
jgi:EAL domain-containing protein (putative c-di-GMP-specific phosphodiesterase class I)